MAISDAEKRVHALAVESRIDYYVGILKQTRDIYEKAFKSSSYPEKLKRDTLGLIEIVVGRLAWVKDKIRRYRSTLQDFYIRQALQEIQELRYAIGSGVASSRLSRRVSIIVSELEMELRKLLN